MYLMKNRNSENDLLHSFRHLKIFDLKPNMERLLEKRQGLWLHAAQILALSFRPLYVINQPGLIIQVLI